MKNKELIEIKENFFKKIINKIKIFIFKIHNNDNRLNNKDNMPDETINDNNSKSKEKSNSNRDSYANEDNSFDDYIRIKPGLTREKNELADGKKDELEEYKKHFINVYQNVREGKTKINELDDVDLLFVNRFMYNEVQKNKKAN